MAVTVAVAAVAVVAVAVAAVVVAAEGGGGKLWWRLMALLMGGPGLVNRDIGADGGSSRSGPGKS